MVIGCGRALSHNCRPVDIVLPTDDNKLINPEFMDIRCPDELQSMPRRYDQEEEEWKYKMQMGFLDCFDVDWTAMNGSDNLN